MSGSDNNVAVESIVPGGGGTAASVNFSMDAHLGGPALPDAMASASFALEGGVTLSPITLNPSSPLVFGVKEGGGSKDGSPATVFGMHFNAPGSGATSAQFAGSAASGLTVASNTTITLTTPVGVNVHGNPLALVDVQVDNALGSSTAEDAYIYEPGMVQDNPARIGQIMQLTMHSELGSFVGFGLGFSIPGFAIAVPPIEGKLELITGLQMLTPLIPSGGAFSLNVPIPNNPSAVGVVVDFQGIAFSSFAPPVQASWTNMVPVTVVP